VVSHKIDKITKMTFLEFYKKNNLWKNNKFHVKGVDLKRNLKYLANHILDITINLDSFTNSLEVLYKFYIKFKE